MSLTPIQTISAPSTLQPFGNGEATGAFPSECQAGNTIVIVFGGGTVNSGDTFGFVDASDSDGNTYKLATQNHLVPSNDPGVFDMGTIIVVAEHIKATTPGGTNTVRIDFPSAGTYGSGVAYELPPCSLDQAVGAVNDTAGSGTFSAGPITPSADGAFVVGIFQGDFNGSSTGMGVPQADWTQDMNSGMGGFSEASSRILQTTAETVTYEEQASGTGTWAASVVSLVPTPVLAPVQVKETTLAISAGTTGSVSFDADVTPGNDIVVLLGWATFVLASPDLEPVTVSDGVNTYDYDLHETESDFRGIGMAKATNVAGGPTTIDVELNAAGYAWVALFELPPCVSMSSNALGFENHTGSSGSGEFRALDLGVVLTAMTTTNATTNPDDVSVPSGYTDLGGVVITPSSENACFHTAYTSAPGDLFTEAIWTLNETMGVSVAAWCFVLESERRPRLIQDTNEQSSSGTNVTNYPCPTNNAVQKGNRIVVAIGGHESGVGHSAWFVQDDKGNTYEKDAEVTLGAGYWTQVWSTVADQAGVTTVNWNVGDGATFARILIHEVFNISDGVDDAEVYQSSTTQNEIVISAAVAANLNENEYAFGWLVHNAGVNSIAAPWEVLQFSTSEPTVQAIPGATGSLDVDATCFGSDSWCATFITYYRDITTGPTSTPVTASDSVTVADAVMVGMLHRVIAGDTVVVTDHGSTVRAGHVTAGDIVVVTDSVKPVRAGHVTASDAVSVAADTAHVTRIMPTHANDAVEVADSASARLATARTANDTVHVSDAAASRTTHLTVAFDIVHQADTAAARHTLRLTASDHVAVSDAATWNPPTFAPPAPRRPDSARGVTILGRSSRPTTILSSAQGVTRLRP